MLELILGLIEGLLGVADLVCLIADVYSWIMGRENRIERRNARRLGLETPPRDRWNRRVIVLTVFVCLITGALILWKV